MEEIKAVEVTKELESGDLKVLTLYAPLTSDGHGALRDALGTFVLVPQGGKLRIGRA